MALGGSSGGPESGKGMAGKEHGKLWPQRGEFPTNVGGETMIRCRGIRAPKRCTRRALRGAGDTRGA